MRELFIVCCNGIRYGIWKEAIQSIRGLDALHRIPLSPACIAGILIDDGRTVTVAELSACIGDRHLPGMAPATRQGSILLMEQGEEVTGFAVSGGIDTLPVPAASLLPLPDFLKTQVFDSCAVDDGVPIPVINVAELYKRAMQPGGKLSPGAPRITVHAPRETPEKPGVRIFTAGAELFAVSAAGIAGEAVRPVAVTPLPGMPPHVKGVTFVDGRLLPVIDLAQRINGQGAAPDATMLIADIGGDAYGLLVDHDGGILSGDAATIRPMPAIVRTAWMYQVAMHEGELIPLVDVVMALSDGTLSGGAPEEEPLWQRYAPASRFPELFFRRDVEVVEFSLLGTRHALPKLEVGEVIAFRPCREIPAAPAIVIGLAEHDGEILPVLDLALMFGRRSLATPAWRMLLVNNGDFRALVITEAVFRERRLQVNAHRAVPLKLPHALMYGCYPDADAVRLILNVAAIALHFEKSLIQQFLPALSPEMKMKSAAAIPEAKPEADTVQQPALQQSSPEPHRQAEAAETIEVQQAHTEPAAIVPEPEPVDVDFDFVSSASPAGASSIDVQGSQPPADAWRGPENELLADELPEQLPEETMARESAASRPPPVEEYAVAELDDMPAASAQTPGGFRYQTEVEDAVIVAADERVAAAAAIAPAAGRPLEAPRAAATVGSGAAKRRIAYAAVALLLLAVTLYFSGTGDKPETGRPAAVAGAAGPGQGGAGPAKIEPDLPQPVQTGSAATRSPPVASAASTSARAQIGPAPQPEQARVQSPAHPSAQAAGPAATAMPVPGKDVYVVKPGDTLWDISKHYTGDPYNYPRIGGENSISDYDLIYPGQRINLKK
jgi:purine-binding chemotaxis protein CheW